MKETGILFKGDMVRAILGGRKSQTRRVFKKQPPKGFVYKGDDSNPYLPGESTHYWMDGYAFWRPRLCPYGQVGDRLWVRETSYAPPKPLKDCLGYAADGDHPHDCSYRVVPSIHMPRWASRITLEITGVKVEKQLDITLEDAIAEGFGDEREFNELFLKLNPHLRGVNPWNWALTFKVVS